MKKIDTYEQKEKALNWMVEMAEHPLKPLEKDERTKNIYERTSAAVQEYNERQYKPSEYPQQEEVADNVVENIEEKPAAVNLDEWF